MLGGLPKKTLMNHVLTVLQALDLPKDLPVLRRAGVRIERFHDGLCDGHRQAAGE